MVNLYWKNRVLARGPYSFAKELNHMKLPPSPDIHKCFRSCCKAILIVLWVIAAGGRLKMDLPGNKTVNDVTFFLSVQAKNG